MKTDASGFPENVRRPGILNPVKSISRQIKVMSLKVSRGLEFPVVALPGAAHMPARGKDEKEAARVFCVAATRATHRLVMGVDGEKGYGSKWHWTTPRQLHQYFTSHKKARGHSWLLMKVRRSNLI